mmetsp:Transcript_1675/g.5726  ORF Transcript_1675/g.5726 Transcript_1675/m.5726 type:complete len:296 (-) Transcript_1675:726-1613(-)
MMRIRSKSSQSIKFDMKKLFPLWRLPKTTQTQANLMWMGGVSIANGAVPKSLNFRFVFTIFISIYRVEIICLHERFYFDLVFFKYVDRSRSRHVTTKCTMGAYPSRTFNHPDLLAAFCCDPITDTNCCSQKWYRHYSGNTKDPGWQRNSPLRIELVDLLTDALKAMGGWPTWDDTRCCCFGGSCKKLLGLPPQLVEAFNKVCKIFNDAKLFGMGLQCRAIIYLGAEKRSFLLVLVEKKSDEHLHDVGQTLEHIRRLEEGKNDPRWPCIKETLAWSPPEDWMTRLSPPYNEATNHV